MFYPGWKAYVNGKEERILKANYLFQAIEVKEGRSLVKFCFEPKMVKIGIFISCVALGIVLFLFVVRNKQFLPFD